MGRIGDSGGWGGGEEGWGRSGRGGVWGEGGRQVEPEVDVVHSQAPGCLTEQSCDIGMISNLRRACVRFKVSVTLPHGFPGAE